MNDPVSFDSIAEIGVAIAGFTGIVLALGPRAKTPLSPLDRERVVDLLRASLGAAFLSFVPQIMGAFALDAPTAWRSAHAIFAIYHLGSSSGFLWGVRGRPLRKMRSNLLLIPVGAPILLSQFAVALGFWGDYAYGIYLIALLWLSFVAALQFALLLVTGWRDA